MYEILLGVFLLVALMLIAVILLQQGKGADMGASFGAGGANTVFGASGAGNFLTRATWVLAGIAIALVLTLAYLSSHRNKAEAEKADVFSAEPAAQTVPAASDVPAPAAEAVAPASDVPAPSEPAASEPASQKQPATDVPH